MKKTILVLVAIAMAVTIFGADGAELASRALDGTKLHF
jgi:hypothetical protein